MAESTRNLIPMQALCRAATILRVMAHPYRLRILELLEDRAMRVADLTSELGVAQNVASHHLTLLKAHGILNRHREGRSMYYRLEEPHWIQCLTAFISTSSGT